MKFFLGLILFFGFLQLFQIDRENPPIDKSKEIQAPEEVANILKRGCYDCHSNETTYPLYSYIAPISWAISNNIKNGRKALNFSSFADMDEGLKKLRLDRFEQTIKSGLMPKPAYIKFHPEARLNKDEIEILINWVKHDLIR